MYKVSDLLGKPLLSLSEAQLLGTIGNIYFDDKMTKGTFIMLYTDEEELRFLPLNKLINIENDAAVVKNCEDLSEHAEGLKNPINSHAFNQDGKALGTIKDIVMDGTKVVSFTLENSSISSGNLVSAGKLLIFNDSGKPVKLKPTQKKEKPLPAKKEVEFPVKTAFAPSYDFLLGKKLQRTILSVDGKIIAREGENVTGDIIEDAKREGKLVILALNSL
ncbi:MAG: PRC-barrel domain-containing protein [Clostridiales bacterium]|nr:PRC-barrel domain-containing protein [Clostridiales bacterium]